MISYTYMVYGIIKNDDDNNKNHYFFEKVLLILSIKEKYKFEKINEFFQINIIIRSMYDLNHNVFI